MRKLLLASNNSGKLREMKDLLKDLNLELYTPSDLGIQLQVKETGQTYAENAGKKALTYAQQAGLLSLADDSGLEVALLDGAPGLYSARYAPQPGADDADRRSYLLEQLQGYPLPWLAKFHCTIVVAEPDGQLYFAEGECPGEIIPKERGDNGFGYDPIFLLPEIGFTMAELSLAQKNKLSHRALAVKAIAPLLLELVS
jgi:XTP/dITP diphosphohydrolase